MLEFKRKDCQDLATIGLTRELTKNKAFVVLDILTWGSVSLLFININGSNILIGLYGVIITILIYYIFKTQRVIIAPEFLAETYVSLSKYETRALNRKIYDLDSKIRPIVNVYEYFRNYPSFKISPFSFLYRLKIIIAYILILVSVNYTLVLKDPIMYPFVFIILATIAFGGAFCTYNDAKSLDFGFIEYYYNIKEIK